MKLARAILLLAVFLALQMTVEFPALHHLIHPDSDEHGHECAVTLFTHGQVDSTEVNIPVVSPFQMVSFLAVPVAPAFVSTDLHILPARGPPA